MGVNKGCEEAKCRWLLPNGECRLEPADYKGCPTLGKRWTFRKLTDHRPRRVESELTAETRPTEPAPAEARNRPQQIMPTGFNPLRMRRDIRRAEHAEKRPPIA